jgi:hypothetical protein
VVACAGYTEQLVVATIIQQQSFATFSSLCAEVMLEVVQAVVATITQQHPSADALVWVFFAGCCAVEHPVVARMIQQQSLDWFDIKLVFSSFPTLLFRLFG